MFVRAAIALFSESDICFRIWDTAFSIPQYQLNHIQVRFCDLFLSSLPLSGLDNRQFSIVSSLLNVASGSSSRSYLNALRNAQLTTRHASSTPVSLARHVSESSSESQSFVKFYDESVPFSGLTNEIQDMVDHVWEIPEEDQAALKRRVQRRPSQSARKTTHMRAAEAEWLQDDSLPSLPAPTHPAVQNVKISTQRSAPSGTWSSRQGQHLNRVSCEPKINPRLPKRVRPSQVVLSPGEPFHDEVSAYQEKCVSLTVFFCCLRLIIPTW